MSCISRSLQVFAFSFAALASSPVYATHGFARSFAELESESDAVVFGQVFQTESKWEGSRIVTYVKFRVESAAKGDVAKEITITTLGGTVDGIGQKVAGMAVFEPDEWAVLFLSKQPILKKIDLKPDTYSVSGWAQGKLRYRPDLGPTTLVRDLKGLSIPVDGELKDAHLVLPEQVSLADLWTELGAPIPQNVKAANSAEIQEDSAQ